MKKITPPLTSYPQTMMRVDSYLSYIEDTKEGKCLEKEIETNEKDETYKKYLNRASPPTLADIRYLQWVS